MENIHNSEKKPHALVVAVLPLQGHVIPIVNLAINLAKRGFVITFVHTEKAHHQITKAFTTTTTTETQTSHENYDLFSEARRQNPNLDLRYETVSDGFPLTFDRSLENDQFWEGFLDGFPSIIDDLVNRLVQVTQPPITCLISDTFMPCNSMISAKYNLVSVSFWTQPALVFNLYYHLDLLHDNGHFACEDKRQDIIDYIPGDLTSHLQTDDTDSVINQIIYKSFEEVKKADIVISNTVQELEPTTISALQQNQPFYAIGPIISSGFSKSPIETSLWSEYDCTHWLNTKPEGSVLYVSFGSVAPCSKYDIQEIAHALLLSEVNFIWVLRPGIAGFESNLDGPILPSGFEDCVKNHDVGLIVPWCSQVKVLSHPAIGGFLTHCGWNSILESIWCCVPLLCFPLFADQLTNRKLVVDDWKIGIDLREYKKQITRHEVASKIHILMNGKLEDCELRKKVNMVKVTLKKALSSPTGSSEKNLTQFVCDLKGKAQMKKKDLSSK